MHSCVHEQIKMRYIVQQELLTLHSLNMFYLCCYLKQAYIVSILPQECFEDLIFSFGISYAAISSFPLFLQ